MRHDLISPVALPVRPKRHVRFAVQPRDGASRCGDNCPDMFSLWSLADRVRIHEEAYEDPSAGRCPHRLENPHLIEPPLFRRELAGHDHPPFPSEQRLELPLLCLHCESVGSAAPYDCGLDNTEISGEAPFVPGFVRCISLFCVTPRDQCASGRASSE
jgi:hypothetical protein